MGGMNVHTNLYILFLSYSLHVRPYVVTTLDNVMHEFENITHLYLQVGGIQMTKERKLAIQMWQGIKNEIAKNPYLSDIGIYRLKQKFCIQHKLQWNCHCWFCQYIPNCRQCPLRNCFVYHIVCTSWNNKEMRLEACDIIIAALEGRCAVL